MSVKISNMVWSDPTITSRTDLLVMLAIADCADDEGMAYPGIERLALKSRCSQRAVQKVISRLISQKKLIVDYNASRFKTNVYRLYLGTPNAVHPEPTGSKTEPKKGSLRSPDPSVTISTPHYPSQTKESPLHGVVLFGSKEEQLERIRVPKSKVPSEEEFKAFILSSTENIMSLIGSGEQYDRYHKDKWHLWNDKIGRWEIIQNWRLTVQGLDRKIGEARIGQVA